MDIQKVIEHFGSRPSDTASALGVTRQAVEHWIKTGYIPPPRQQQIAELTFGKFSPDKKPWER